MIIGNRIKKARILKGYNQQELGDLLEVSKVSVCGYEKGNRTPTIENFIKLIEILDCEPNYLLGRDHSIVCEDDEEYVMKFSKEEIDIIEELKKHPELYNRMVSDPKRSVELLSRRIK